ncbi:BrnA antitoxin family protein [Rhizobium metallidurans]|uniref:Uncharacterized protein (DUF4415 family) n=1 Tax=Rhizobium metallidurans TaxID=1265931 RepID=A0A7W6CSG0_9HYPH|nr:BrnA antitoxin family protein [Rhizobium metallidurans]MBB3965626.1 uncharacterized protein (DUF4415 family) [Rhizobium metallidurans]
MTKSKAAKGTDWARVQALSDDEIERMAIEDAENPASAAADWADAAVGLPPLKAPVNAKFDADVVEWFKSQGRGYQTRMNAVLRMYMESHRKTG